MNSQHSMNARRRNVALLIVSLCLAALLAVALDRTDANPAHAPIMGAFTGEITADGPVYRLPPIHIVANRRNEMARIEREDQLDRAREVRARTGRKPNA